MNSIAVSKRGISGWRGGNHCQLMESHIKNSEKHILRRIFFLYYSTTLLLFIFFIIYF